jgi:hypothetical protein
VSAVEADEELEVGVLAGIRAAYDPAYGPVVVAAGIVQLVAIPLQHLGLALAAFAVGALADLATADERNAVRGRLRRFGLGLLQRVTFRLAMLLAVALPVGVPTVVTAGAIVGLLLVGLATRAVGFALLKVVRARPALPAANLAPDLPLVALYERLRRRRVVLIGALAAGELPVGLALWLGTRGATVAGLVVLTVTASLLVAVTLAVVGWSVRFRRSDALDRHVAALEAAIADTGARIVLYFSADREGTYQLNQWLPVFDRLDEPVLVVLREAGHLERMLPTRHPVVVCPRHRDVEVALACDPLVACYVGMAGRNIHFLRYARPLHVFLNHGDSDKVSSANPVVRVHDRLFVAGPVAIERYREAGIELGDERFEVVGRPQLDGVLDRRQRLGEGPPTLLYAPTWEGYFEAADYSSVERQGVALVRHVLERRPDVRIVFKPHPASGTVRPAARAAVRAIEILLREAGAPHVVAADHPELDLLAWFDRADVLLSDISAVVTDFLVTDKPYLVTNPRGVDRAEFRRRFPSHHGAYVVAQDLGDLDEHLAAAFGPDPMAGERARMKHRVLGDTPDGALATFVAALERAKADAREQAARVVNTFAYDR